MAIDPGIELLPDVPIAGARDDLLGRAPLAERLIEVACAQPTAQPRVVGLVGTAGAGKTSVVRLAQAALAERADAATVAVDATEHGTVESLLATLQRHLSDYFDAAGVVERTDAARDALARYGEVVSTVVRLVGVKVDVAGAVKRSQDSVAAELVENAYQVGKRLVVIIDHLDRLPDRDLVTALVVLRMYAQLPYTTMILAYDRRALAARTAIEASALARLVTVEVAVPPCDRTLLARLVAGGVARVGARLGRDTDAILPLFDPDDATGLALALLETPRDGKRAVNALAAALPLWPAGDLGRAALDLVVRLVAPVIDTPRLVAVASGERAGRRAELRAAVAHLPIAAALGPAIDALLA
ncbi:MAG: AAA family ATPase [Myxococcales bacterium]|nr:AAA family ATPase [Myxococcales bacterium]